MKTRTLVVLGVVLVALAVAATAPSWWPSGDEAADDTVDAAAALHLEGIDVDDIDELRIRRVDAKGPIVATRSGSSWTVAGKPTDAAKVDQLLELIERLDRAEATLVSRSADRHRSLGLTVSSGTLLTINIDGESHEVLIGNAGDVADTWYGRAADADRSWQLSGGMLAALPTDADAWLVKPSGSDAAPGVEGGSSATS